MRRWATALRQVAMIPPIQGQGPASSATPMGLHLDYSEEFRSRRTGDIPPAFTSSLSSSFPFLEKARPEDLHHLLSLNSQKKQTVRGPHHPRKRARRMSASPPKMLVRSLSGRGK